MLTGLGIRPRCILVASHVMEQPLPGMQGGSCHGMPLTIPSLLIRQPGAAIERFFTPSQNPNRLPSPSINVAEYIDGNQHDSGDTQRIVQLQTRSLLLQENDDHLIRLLYPAWQFWHGHFTRLWAKIYSCTKIIELRFISQPDVLGLILNNQVRTGAVRRVVVYNEFYGTDNDICGIGVVNQRQFAVI